MKYLNNQTLMITGGTGSFGKAFISKIINNKIKLKKLIIFSETDIWWLGNIHCSFIKEIQLSNI